MRSARRGAVPACTLGPIMDSETATDEATTLPSTAPRVHNRRTRAASILMVAALVCLGVSAVLFAVPVSSPGVQQCGSPAWFLLRAQSNRALLDSNGEPINDWTQAQVRKAYTQRCSVQVARRAIPAAMLLAAFWLLVVIALILGWSGRRALGRKLQV